MSQVVIGSGSTASESVAPANLATPPSTVVLHAEKPIEKPIQAPAQQAPAASTQPPAQQGTADTSQPQDRKQSDDSAPSFEIAGLDMSELATEYATSGVLSEESYKELEENGFPKEVVDAYIRGVEASTVETGELAQKEVDSIINEVGGEEKYEQVMKWAAATLTPEEQKSYNKAVTSKHPDIARLVVHGLVSRYERTYGRAPSLVSGDRSVSVPAGFANRSEMVAAMSDSRYGKDPDYTREVESKVISSGLMRGGKRRT